MGWAEARVPTEIPGYSSWLFLLPRRTSSAAWLFHDVDAETRALARTSSVPDFERGLAFLMAWPALPEAARMIERRADDIDVTAEQAEQWAAKLRRRFPKAAHTLLRRAAAAAFRRRDFKTCDRLSAEAETIAT